MNNFWKWVLGIAVALIVLFVLLFVFTGFGPYGSYGWRGMPMMGGYHMGFGFFPFGMLLMWLVPVGTFILLVLGIVWLVNSLGKPKTPARACAHCGKAVQPDWNTCPYCGSALS